MTILRQGAKALVLRHLSVAGAGVAWFMNEQKDPSERGGAALPGHKTASGTLVAPSRPWRRRGMVAALGALGLCLLVVMVVSMRQPAEVMVETVVPGRVEKALAVVGRAQPAQRVDVRSSNAGQIISLLADEGDEVVEGQTLAVLRSVVETAQTDALAARERAANAELARAKRDLGRIRQLADKGIAARAALEDAQASVDVAEAQLATAAADRRAAAARAGEFTILAPMTGRILLRPVDNGQFVSPETSLFELGSSGAVEIVAEIDEIYSDDMRPGLRARAALSGSDIRFAAVVSEVAPQVNPATGGRLVRLVPEKRTDLPPGRSVDITIIVSEEPEGFTLPRQAILEATTAPKVHLVGADGVVTERPVVIDRWPSVNAIVRSGLSAGDLVVLDPDPQQLSKKVRPVELAGAQRPGTGE